MGKTKRYPYGTIPSRKDVEQFRERNTNRYYPTYSSNMDKQEDSRTFVPFGPIVVEEGELEALYRIKNDWTAVYAAYNMD